MKAELVSIKEVKLARRRRRRCDATTPALLGSAFPRCVPPARWNTTQSPHKPLHLPEARLMIPTLDSFLRAFTLRSHLFVDGFRGWILAFATSRHRVSETLDGFG
jgi:hypothetical protein